MCGPRRRPSERRAPGRPKMRRRNAATGRTTIRRALLLLALAALAAVLAPTPALADTQTFYPVADAYVSAAKPYSNYGAQSRLKVNGRPTVNSYLRSHLQLPAGAAISSASLELNAASGYSAQGFSVDAVADSSWDEYALTYQNAPPLGAELGASGPWSTSGYKAVSLPPSALAPGLNSFAATSATVTKALTFYSRESASPPRLQVSYTVGPAPPGNLSVTATSQTSISLSWVASPDPSTVGYDVYRDGTAVATTSQTAYT